MSPSPGANCSDVPRNAGLDEQLRSPSTATSGVCSAGLATTLLPATSAAAIWPMKIASGKFHGEMQTKTPRPMPPQGHFLRRSVPARPSSRQNLARLPRVVAAKIGRLADFRQRVVERLAGFALQQRDQRSAPRLDQIGGALDHRARASRRLSRSIRESASRAACHRGVDGACVGFDDIPDLRAVYRRRRRRAACRRRLRRGSRRYGGRARRRSRRAGRKARRCRQTRRRRNWRAAADKVRAGATMRGLRAGLARRSARKGRRRSVDLRRHGIGRARDERGVGAVLDQAAHEIGEQIAVRPDRRIDAPAGCATVQTPPPSERLAHAVQALKLEVFARAGHRRERPRRSARYAWRIADRAASLASIARAQAR